MNLRGILDIIPPYNIHILIDVSKLLKYSWFLLGFITIQGKFGKILGWMCTGKKS